MTAAASVKFSPLRFIRARIRFTRKTWRKRLGDAGEHDAAKMLAQKGYTVLLQDCRTPRGELDLVCLDGASFVFVEVKTRFFRPGRSTSRPEPWRELSDAQKRRIYRGAISFLYDMKEHGDGRLFRFDLVEVLRGPFGPVEIRHHPGFMGRPNYSAKGTTPARVFRRRKNAAAFSLSFPVE